MMAEEPVLSELVAQIAADAARESAFNQSGPTEDAYVDESGRTVKSRQKLIAELGAAAAVTATGANKSAAELAAANATTAAQIAQSVAFFDSNSALDCIAAQTVALPSNTYSNGASGVGATITATANGGLSSAVYFDGVTVSVGQTVFVRLESAGKNWLYTVTSLGSGATPWVLTRLTASDTAAEIGNAVTAVQGGVLFAGAKFRVDQAAGAITVGTTALTYTMQSFATAAAQALATKNAADLQADVTATTVSQSHGIATNTGGTNATTDTTRVNAITCTKRSTLGSVKIRVGTSGNFKFKKISLGESDSGTLFVTTDIATVALTAGDNQVLFTQLGATTFQPGDYLGVYAGAGGTVQFDTGPAGSSFTINGDSAGTQTFNTSASILKINPTFLSLTGDTVTTQFPPARRTARALLSGLSSSPGNTRFASAAGATQDAIATHIELYVQTAGDGTGTGYIARPNPTLPDATITASWAITGLVTGINKVAIPDTVLAYLTAGSVFGFAHTTGQAQIAFTDGGADYSASSTLLSGNVTLTASTNTFRVRGYWLDAGSAEYRLERHRRQLAINAAAIAALQSASVSRVNGNALDAKFVGALAAPTGIESAGAWTYPGAGIKSPASGSWSTYVRHSLPSTLDDCLLTAHVVVTDTNSVFGLIANGLSLSGSACEINGSTGQLTIYNEWNSSAGDPASGTSVAIGFALVAGRKYICTMRKSFETDAGNSKAFVSLTLTDSLTQQTATHKRYYPGGGSGWGKKGVVFLSGDITVKRITYLTKMPTNARMAVYGDSRVEGNSIPNNRDARWHQLAAAALGSGKVFVSGMGGATSTDLVARFPADFAPFGAPRYVVIEIGTNDTVYSTWLSNTQALIAAVESVGSIPVLCTMPPRSTNQTFLNQANAWILASQYRYVDFAAALTVGNDRVTWDMALNTGDGVHENVAGHAANYAQLRADVPEIFE